MTTRLLDSKTDSAPSFAMRLGDSEVLPWRTALYGGPVSVDREAREVEVVISTPARDRQGDVVEPAGLDFRNFLPNPVVLWAHDMDAPPVGKVLAVAVSGDAVRAKIRFADTPFAKELFDLCAGGYLRAWSIGFLPKRWERLRDAEGGPDGFRILEAEVVEVSAVPVPANPEALTRALPALAKSLLRPLPSTPRRRKTDGAARGVGLADVVAGAAALVSGLTENAATRAFAAARGMLA